VGNPPFYSDSSNAQNLGGVKIREQLRSAEDGLISVCLKHAEL